MKHIWLPVLGALVAWASPASAQGDVDWSGFYFGAHAGFAGAFFNNEVPAFPGPTDEAGSFMGGGHAGYNWQSDAMVFGAEFDASLIDLEGDSAAGRFQEDFMTTARLRAGAARFKAIRRMNDSHNIEDVGAKLRAMMPWIGKNKLVDKARN